MNAQSPEPRVSNCLDGRVALVTGSSRGIGRAIALDLAASGASVAINYRVARDAANDVVRQIRMSGGTATVHAADVSDPQAVSAMIDDVIELHGRLDILVCNSGIIQDRLLLAMSDADWASVLATNLSGAFYCIRAAARHMLRNRYGRIVTIGSVSGVVGNKGQANYAASKAGLIGLTRAVAVELGSRGITANCVVAGIIETEMTKMFIGSKHVTETLIPVGRIGTGLDVARVVTFLATESSSYITGQLAIVDGGMLLLG